MNSRSVAKLGVRAALGILGLTAFSSAQNGVGEQPPAPPPAPAASASPAASPAAPPLLTQAPSRGGPPPPAALSVAVSGRRAPTSDAPSGRASDRPLPQAPTEQQLAALRILSEESELYQQAASDYQKVLTVVVRHHFQERRRRIISGLDRAVESEQKKLTEWRAEAIRRLERFVGIYSGPNAHSESTPDAMYRLAALYEERARADVDAELGEALKPAIGLYREIIAQFPAYL
ncbi:MAG: hypothetical protein RJA70_1550, partial [Pseudomonadota bacterium]